MLITKRSAVSGKEHTIDIPISQEQLDLLNSPDRGLIQDILPNLTADEREFLISGATAEEWKALFPKKDA